MKQSLKILLLVLMCFAATSAQAFTIQRVPLWGGASYGMTVSEVLAAIPTVHRCSENIKPPFPDGGLQALAILENVEISGEKFNTWFMFSEGKLSQVTLSWVPKIVDMNTPSPYADLNGLYSKYTWLLGIKYGNPVRTIQQTFGPPIPAWYAQWVSGLTNIDLNIDKTRLDITYGAEYAETLRRL